MKCEKCGYSLQIEDSFCPSCGTPNAFAKQHRENMAKYTEAFNETQQAVVERTRKTAGAMMKLSICVIMLFIIIALVVIKNNPTLKKNARIKKVKANIEYYRDEFTKMEASKDYITLKTWFAYNDLNIVPEFVDCLPVFNVSMYYDYLAAYLCEITYPDYMEYAVRDYENYCESIVESYDQIISYSQKEMGDSQYQQGHKECIDACVNQSRVLIQATFKLTDEQMAGFDSMSESQKIVLLEENWPYEK